MQNSIHEKHIDAVTDNAHTSAGIFLSGKQQVIYSGVIPTAKITMQVADGNQLLADVASTEWVDVPNSDKTASLTTYTVDHGEVWGRFVISGGGADTITVTTHRIVARDSR